jgi:hypothetical protein
MADRNQDRTNAGWDQENDAVDPKFHRQFNRELDAALANYAAAEPRPGLEDRVLANLRAERPRVTDRAWWRWSVASALAVIVIMTLALAWRSGKPSHPVVADHSTSAAQTTKEPATQVVSNDSANDVRPQASDPAKRRATRSVRREAVAAATPKLDQFPSPQPLSEQERILQSYVAAYPEEAVLIARARSEALQRDLEEMKALASGRPPTGSEDDTTER